MIDPLPISFEDYFRSSLLFLQGVINQYLSPSFPPCLLPHPKKIGYHLKGGHLHLCLNQANPFWGGVFQAWAPISYHKYFLSPDFPTKHLLTPSFPVNQQRKKGRIKTADSGFVCCLLTQAAQLSVLLQCSCASPLKYQLVYEVGTSALWMYLSCQCWGKVLVNIWKKWIKDSFWLFSFFWLLCIIKFPDVDMHFWI